VKDRVALPELVRGEEEGVGAGIAMVSSLLDFGVNSDPHDPQKRLLSNISAEQDGHLVIQRNSLKRYTSFPFANSRLQLRSADSTAYCGSPLALNTSNE
jgi:hypothetical protein